MLQPGEVQGLVAATSANQKALSAVAESVQHSQPLAPAVVELLKRDSAKPVTSTMALESAQRQLNAVTPVLRALRNRVEIQSVVEGRSK